MDDDGKSNINDEIVFLWDGYSYIYVVSPPDSAAGQTDAASPLFR